MSLLTTAVQGILEILWPPRVECLLCQGRLGDSPWNPTCSECWESMPFSSTLLRCTSCCRPFEGAGRQCPECRAGFAFGRVHALGLHAGALREAIHHLKFNGRAEFGELLGRRLGAGIAERYGCIVPVPLHGSRLRERGYNQAGLIAQGIGEEIGLPVVDHALVRRRKTGHQAKLQREERIHNLDGAFGVKAGSREWVGQRVLLVDDVLTTGATAGAAAQVLRESGAGRVDLAVLAVSTKPVLGN